MATSVTILMYSGVPNPTWELTPEQEATFLEILNNKTEKTFTQSASSAGMLGYRGFEIHSTGDDAIPKKALIFDSILDTGDPGDLNVIDSDSELELFLLSTAETELDKEEIEIASQSIQKNSKGGIASSVKDFTLKSVPPFNPSKWNNDSHVKRNNNCYNYANDKITNTFAQPGRGSGTTGPYPPTCSGTGSAAQRDGQKPISSAASTPSQGHYIALVVWPGRDYHWYRLDSNGRWSHKPGQTSARNTDNSGGLISDPKNCDRGPYTIFCGYYHCIPSQTRIR